MASPCVKGYVKSEVKGAWRLVVTLTGAKMNPLNKDLIVSVRQQTKDGVYRIGSYTGIAIVPLIANTNTPRD